MVAAIRVKGEPDEVLGCPTCMQAKFTRFPFSSSEATAKAPLDEVVMDVVGPLKLGAAGAEYFLTIVDVYTRMTWVYVLSKKSDMAETVKTDWLPMVERQQDRLVKAIRTDQGGEFLSKDFGLWLKKNGIRHSLTMPYSPAMNGITERANRTITETARGLLIEAGLPDYFWPDAMRSACVAKNRALTHVGADKWVPYVEWIGRKPKVDMLRVFRCMCMALVPKHLRHNKLGAKAIWAVHLGMAQKSKGWLLWDPFAKKFLKSRDCKFIENLMYKDWKAENEENIGMRFGEVKSSGLEHVELPLELSIGSTTTRQSSLVNGGEEAKDAKEEEEEVQQSDYEECAFAFFSPVEMPGEPATLKEALESSDAEDWKKAMKSELKSIEENGTWELVELPEGRKAITSKWLFKIKSDADGKIERYKSRLVAKGYHQKEKVDYKELFAPVVEPTTLRTLLAGAAIKGWVVKQMDVTTAFLNGVLEEEIFMAQPEGGPYVELVGCLMYLITCTRPLSVLAPFVATGRHRPVHRTATVRVANYLATTSCVGLVLGGAQPVLLTDHCDSSNGDNVETKRSTQRWQQRRRWRHNKNGSRCTVPPAPVPPDAAPPVPAPPAPGSTAPAPRAPGSPAPAPPAPASPAPVPPAPKPPAPGSLALAPPALAPPTPPAPAAPVPQVRAPPGLAAPAPPVPPAPAGTPAPPRLVAPAPSTPVPPTAEPPAPAAPLLRRVH
ncbi:unnamed protein product [Closterium sp. NIES-54]